MKFIHIVGKSTFKYGFTIPKSVYPFITLQQKGIRKSVTLITNNNIKTEVWLSRLNNEHGHLQIRYDNKKGEPFRNWLIDIFKNSYNKSNNLNEYFEIEIINDSIYKIIPYPIKKNESNLTFSNILTHNIKEDNLVTQNGFIEILESIRKITFTKYERQMYYNFRIKQELTKFGWANEQKIVEDNKIRLKCDFRKKDFQLEVEFGNARTYYQDIIKFVMSHNAGLIKIGGLIVPSKNFADHLCHLGSKNASEKSNGNKSKYSGMMNFNKAVNEFKYIKDIFDIPFFIVGINGKLH